MAKKSSLSKTLTIIVTCTTLTLSVATGIVIGHAFNKTDPNSQIPGGGEKTVRSVESIDKTNTYGLIDEYTITYTDGTTSKFIVANGQDGEQGIQGFPGVDGHTPTIVIGANGNWIVDDVDTGVAAQGPQGNDGRSIVSIDKTETNGLIDTYTITYSDGTTSSFIVVNGADGQQGIQGIQGIPGQDGQTPTIEIDATTGNWVINGVDTGISARGPQGDPGRSIVSIEKTNTDGLVDTYTITYSDNSTSTFVVVNGENGQQGIQGIPGQDGATPTVEISASTGNWVINGVDSGVKATGPQGPIGPEGPQGPAGFSVLTGNGEPAPGQGANGDSYIDLNTWNYYVKKDGVWEQVGNIKGGQGDAGEAGRSIVSVIKTGTTGLVDTYTITYSDNTTSTFTIVNGADGEKGDTPVITIDPITGNWVVDGNNTGVKAQGETGQQGEAGKGISSIILVGTVGLVTTYRIIFTDSSTFEYTVTNGANGEDGKDGTSLYSKEGVPANSFGQDGDAYINLLTWDYYVKKDGAWELVGNIKGAQGNPGTNGTNGTDGTDGEDGVSITSITKTSTSGLVDTYTITYSDGSTSTFDVTNGQDGSNGADGQDGSDGKTIMIGSGAPNAGTGGVDGDSYIDIVSWNFYKKISGTWQLQGNIKGEQGISITSITLAGSSGLVDTYTITYSDGSTDQFTVTNGKDGNTVLTGHGAPTGGVEGDSYIDLDTWNYYVKTGSGWGDPVGNIKGQRGNTVSTGHGAPNNGDGIVGDSYIDLDTWNYYVKTNTGWGDPVGNIKGATGLQGDPGTDGTSITTGHGAPTSLNAQDGDSYIDIDTWDIYVYSGGSWGTPVGNIHTSPNVYTVSFETDGGSAVADIDDAREGQTITKPASDPTKAGFIFQGWFTSEGNRWDFEKDVITGDITLYAHWAIFKVVNGVLVESTATGDVTIPEYFDDQLVVAIGPSVFKDNTAITTVTIPHSVKAIRTSAFENCTGLVSMIIPNSVESISQDAFKGCTNMAYVYFENPNPTAPNALNGGNPSRAVYYSGLRSIGDGAFANTGLRAFALPNSVQSIGEGILSANKGWTYYDSVKEMFSPNAEHVFLTDVDPVGAVSGDIRISTTYGDVSVHTGTTWLHVDTFNEFIGINNGVTDPTGGDSEDFNAFYINTSTGDLFINCTSTLESLSLPFVGGNVDGSTNAYLGYIFGASSADENASYVPGSIRNVTITGNSPIAASAMKNCNYVKSITITGDPSSIGFGAFEGCTRLKTMTIPYVGGSSDLVKYSYAHGAPSVHVKADIYFDVDTKNIYMNNSGWSLLANLEDLTGGLPVMIGEGGPDSKSITSSSDIYFDYVEGNLYGVHSSKWECQGNLAGTLPGSTSYFGYLFGAADVYDSSTYVPRALINLNVAKGNGENRDIIPSNAFMGCCYLENVSLSDNITTISNTAFYECSEIKSIVMSDSVTHIGAAAFYRCYSLRSIILPKNLSKISYSAFEQTGLESVVIPDSVLVIEGNAFARLSHLEYVILPSNLKSIGSYAFEHCNDLTSIVVPSSVEYLGLGCFEDCDSLTSITLPFIGSDPIGGALTGDQSIFWIFNDDDLDDNLKTIILTGGNGANRDSIPASAFYQCRDIVTIVLPSGIKTIGNQAFYDNRALKNINFPNGLVSIGDGAFYNTALEEVVLPGTVTTLGDQVFYSCTKLVTFAVQVGANKAIGHQLLAGATALKTLYIGDNISSFGAQVIYGCNALEYVYLGNGLTAIENAMFASRLNLSTVILPNSVTSIGVSAFANCKSLYNIALPSNLATIGNNAFYNCTNLQSIIIPNSVTTIDHLAFSHCSNLRSVTLSNQLVKIDKQTFENCAALESIYIPASVHYIETHAFQNCTMLRYVLFSEGLLTIHEFAFLNCSSLVSVALPNSLVDIGRGVFDGCTSLESISLPFTGASLNGVGTIIYDVISTSAPDNAVGNDNDIYVDTYNKKIWRKINGVWYNQLQLSHASTPTTPGSLATGHGTPDAGSGEEDFYINVDTSEYYEKDAGEPSTWRYIGKLNNLFAKIGYAFVSDSGTNEYKAFNNCLPESLKTVVITKGTFYPGPNVYIINEGAFYGCRYIETVVLDNAIVAIMPNAFQNCISLKNINIPNSTIGVMDEAFNGCVSLVNVSIGDSSMLMAFGVSCFENCKSLKTITIPNSVNLITNYTFRGCTSLEQVVWGNAPTVAGISLEAFKNCTSLSSFVIPATVEKISDSAFENCSSMKYVYFKESNGKLLINQYAFKNCSALEEIVIPNTYSNLEICSSIFNGCTSLKSITLGNLTQSLLVGVTSSNNNNYYDPTNLDPADGSIPFWLNSTTGDLFFPIDNSWVKVTNIKDSGTITVLGLTDDVPSDSDGSDGDVVVIGYKYYVKSSGHWSSGKALYPTKIGFLFNDEGDNSRVPSSLKTFVLTDGIDESFIAAFKDCASLEAVVLPKGTTAIGAYAFSGCTNLKTVFVPGTVVSIGDYAFSNCENFAEFEVLGSWFLQGVASHGNGAPDSGYGDWGDYYYSEDTSTLYEKSFMFGGWYDFYQYSYGSAAPSDDKGRLSDVFINFSTYEVYSKKALITTIGVSAFEYCTSMVSANLPNTVTTIKESAFLCCSSLTRFVLPPNVTVIEEYTFLGCTGLQDFDLAPAENLERIKTYAFGSCGFKYFAIYTYSPLVIDQYAFQNCSNLERLYLSYLTINSIGRNAFDGCVELEEVLTTGSVIKSIGERAFQSCASLKSIAFENGLTFIDEYAFMYCTSLKSVVLPSTLETNSWCAFYGCSSLESMTIPFVGKTATTGRYFGYIFGSNTPSAQYLDIPASLKTVTITGGTVNDIPQYAFRDCINIENIVLGSGITSIGQNAFDSCSRLRTIELPASLSSVGQNAFVGCGWLTTVYYGGSSANWSSISINATGNDNLTNADRRYAA